MYYSHGDSECFPCGQAGLASLVGLGVITMAIVGLLVCAACWRWRKATSTSPAVGDATSLLQPLTSTSVSSRPVGSIQDEATRPAANLASNSNLWNRLAIADARPL
eukprot:1367791-Prymnesium_polylepis.1